VDFTRYNNDNNIDDCFYSSKEIGRFKLFDTQELVATVVDDEKLDLRIFLTTDSYERPTKRGVRFYLFDDNWTEFKKLIEKVDKAYNEIG